MKLKLIDSNKTKKDIALKGYSINSFAKKINSAPSYVSRVLNNKQLPSPPFAKKMADGLGVMIKDIFC